jgi:hypothetical protein
MNSGVRVSAAPRDQPQEIQRLGRIGMVSKHLPELRLRLLEASCIDIQAGLLKLLG